MLSFVLLPAAKLLKTKKQKTVIDGLLL